MNVNAVNPLFFNNNCTIKMTPNVLGNFSETFDVAMRIQGTVHYMTN